MTTACPQCQGVGRAWKIVPTREFKYGKLLSMKELRQCSTCYGKGQVVMSLPQSTAQVLFFPELGFQKEKRWRAMPEDFACFGSIRGLPQYTGTAIATDGILVIIEQSDGRKVVGHLNSFEPVKMEKNGNGERKKKPDVNEGLFD